jgi:hypothetical protein
MALPEPYEYLDLNDQGSMTLRVDSYQDGTAVIHPVAPSPRHVRIHMTQQQLEGPPAAGTPISIEVPVLRLFGDRLDQSSPVHYFDVSSKTLRADLLARFTGGLQLPATVIFTANGHKPRKRYSVEVLSS